MEHRKGDKLYELTDYDGGLCFDYVEDIKHCPLCGKELKEDYSDTECICTESGENSI